MTLLQKNIWVCDVVYNLLEHVVVISVCHCCIIVFSNNSWHLSPVKNPLQPESHYSNYDGDSRNNTGGQLEFIVKWSSILGHDDYIQSHNRDTLTYRNIVTFIWTELSLSLSYLWCEKRQEIHQTNIWSLLLRIHKVSMEQLMAWIKP